MEIEDRLTGMWYARDLSNHGGSEVKRFRRVRTGLEWDADLDGNFDVIDAKHKSDRGKFIPFSELGSG